MVSLPLTKRILPLAHSSFALRFLLPIFENMKKFFLFLFAFGFSLIPCLAQGGISSMRWIFSIVFVWFTLTSLHTQNFIWAKSSQGTGYDESWSVATDLSGN